MHNKLTIQHDPMTRRTKRAPRTRTSEGKWGHAHGKLKKNGIAYIGYINVKTGLLKSVDLKDAYF